MDERRERRARRLRLRRAAAPALPRETAESVLPELPRVGALDALLREVDSLRMSLETDLTLAASAVEQGALDVASDIIDAEREGLKAFEHRALGHLSELAKPRRRVRVPAAPFVAAAAVVGFLLGVVPHLSTPTAPADTTISATNTADASLALLRSAVATGNTVGAVDAASLLHAQLEAAVAQAKTDPKAAQLALSLLRKERSVITSSMDGSNPSLKGVLNASLQLTQQITSQLPTVLPTVTPPVLAIPVTTASPHTSPAVATQPTSSPKPSSSPKPKPKPKPSSTPTTKASPTPSASSSSGHTLPTSPNLNQ